MIQNFLIIELPMMEKLKVILLLLTAAYADIINGGSIPFGGTLAVKSFTFATNFFKLSTVITLSSNASTRWSIYLDPITRNTLASQVSVSIPALSSAQLCPLEVAPTVENIIVFTGASATLRDQETYTVKSTITPSSGDSFLDCQFSEDCLKIYIASKGTDNKIYLNYYQNKALFYKRWVASNQTFRQMAIKENRIFVRTDKAIYIFQQTQYMSRIYTIRLTTPHNQSAMLYYAGYLVYSMDAAINVVAADSWGIVVANLSMSEAVRQIKPLNNSQVVVLTYSFIYELSALPLLGIVFSVATRSPSQPMLMHAISDLKIVIVTLPATGGVLFQLATMNYTLPVIPPPPPVAPVAPTPPPTTTKPKPKKNITIAERIIALTNQKATFKSLQPLSILIDQFHLNKYHRQVYPALMQLLTYETDFLHGFKTTIIAQIQNIKFRPIQRRNTKYLARFAVQILQSDPDEFFFVRGLLHLFFNNCFTVFIIFGAIKCFQLALNLIPSRIAVARYLNKQLKKQSTAVILFVSMVEANIIDGTVACFGQISVLFSFQPRDKLSIVVCMLFLFTIIIYSLCFYLLQHRNKFFEQRVLLYFSKPTLRGCFLHTFIVNCKTIVFAFANCYLFYSPRTQNITIFILSVLVLLFCLFFKASFVSSKIGFLYIFYAAVTMLVNLMLMLDSIGGPKWLSFKCSEFTLVLYSLIGVLLLHTLAKIMVCIVTTIQQIISDWAQVQLTRSRAPDSDRQSHHLSFIPVEVVNVIIIHHHSKNKNKDKGKNKNKNKKTAKQRPSDNEDAENIFKGQVSEYAGYIYSRFNIPDGKSAAKIPQRKQARKQKMVKPIK